MPSTCVDVCSHPGSRFLVSSAAARQARGGLCEWWTPNYWYRLLLIRRAKPVPPARGTTRPACAPAPRSPAGLWLLTPVSPAHPWLSARPLWRRSRVAPRAPTRPAGVVFFSGLGPETLNCQHIHIHAQGLQSLYQARVVQAAAGAVPDVGRNEEPDGAYGQAVERSSE